MKRVASRWQVADPLTKKGLADTMRQVMRDSVTRLHEDSAQEIKRKAAFAEEESMGDWDSVFRSLRRR